MLNKAFGSLCSSTRFMRRAVLALMIGILGCGQTGVAVEGGPGVDRPEAGPAFDGSVLDPWKQEVAAGYRDVVNGATNAVDASSAGGVTGGATSPPSDSGTSPSQACLASPVVANCPVVDVRYYFNRDVGKCAQTQGCEATENTFATVAECETACIRILNCSCTVGAGACDSQGLCGTCPSPNLLANLTDTASGLACVNPGLICHITTADTVLWRCRCLAGAKSTTWECVIPISG
jgi:hypothetical protein